LIVSAVYFYINRRLDDANIMIEMAIFVIFWLSEHEWLKKNED